MIGKTISHYKIIEKLGAGGMGEVYLAEDTELDRKVALKFLPPHYTTDPEIKARFKREAKAAAALNHPNIITVYEVGEHEGQTFIAMEYVKGESLRDRIKQQLSPNESIELISQVCDGLSKAHKADIVHRDIKPENIMIDEDGRVRILDFGLAKLRNVSKLTQTAATLGTLNYMSPEQLQGLEVDARTDIWSVGVILYEMITWQLPFNAEYEAAISYSIMHEEPEPLARYKAGVADELQRLVNKALSKDVSTRYQSATDLLADLKGLQSPSATVTMERLVKRRISNRSLSVVGIGILVAIAGYFIFSRYFPPSKTTSGDDLVQDLPSIAVMYFEDISGDEELKWLSKGLPHMLITALEQSSQLRVVGYQRLYDILNEIGKGNVESIDRTIATEIAQRARVKTMLLGSIFKWNKLIRVDYQLQNVTDGGLRHAGKVSDEDPFALADKLAEQVRQNLEVSSATATTKKVVEVTTPDLEAYQHYFLGEQYINELKFKEAQEEFKKAIALDSTFGLAYYRLAYTWSWSNEIPAKEPIQKAMALIDRIPEKERYMVRSMKMLIDAGHEAQLTILKEMEQLYPDDKEMLFNIGDAYYHSRQYDRAVEYFEKVLAMDSTHVRTLEHLAWAYWEQKNYNRSEKLYRKALALDPDNISILNHGWFLLLQKKYSEAERAARAVEYFEKVLAMDSTHAQTLENLAQAYWEQKNYNRSEKLYRKALALDPDNISILDSYGGVLLRQKKYSEAEKIYRKGLAIEPTNGDIIDGLTRILHSQMQDSELKPFSIQDCNDETSLTSLNSDVAAYIRFINQTPKDVKLYWMDYEGQRQLNITLKPGKSQEQFTYLTHPWVITDSDDNCLGTYMPTREPALITFTSETTKK